VDKLPITVKRSYKDGCVSVSITLKTRNFGDSLRVRVEGSTDLTIDQARALAHGLIFEADKADEKVKAKAASDERRQKWQMTETKRRI
jgi:hypothetical protein